jgi:HlyD family secretion protein
MTASADIVTETRTNAVVVPIQCVSVRTPDQLNSGVAEETTEDSTEAPEYSPDKDGFVQVVFVVDQGEAIALQVETGIQSDSHIEVLKGLNEGDEIVTGNYRAISQLLQNNSKVKTQGESETGETLAAN